jgi:hypothetical protein
LNRNTTVGVGGSHTRRQSHIVSVARRNPQR